MTHGPASIYLIGPMGSGKTTVGRLVADRLGLGFVDCDEELERRTGVRINLIFDIEGEAGFRKRETGLLRELAERDGLLVATGGGAVLSDENRRLIGESGMVIWLQTSVDQQLKRLRRDKKRPLLQTRDRRRKLEELARERDPIYAELADMVFVSANRSPRYMAGELTRQLLKRHGDLFGAHGHALH